MYSIVILYFVLSSFFFRPQMQGRSCSLLQIVPARSTNTETRTTEGTAEDTDLGHKRHSRRALTIPRGYPVVNKMTSSTKTRQPRTATGMDKDEAEGKEETEGTVAKTTNKNHLSIISDYVLQFFLRV